MPLKKNNLLVTKPSFLANALLAKLAILLAVSALALPAVALAESSDSQDIGEDQTISPEDLRELGLNPDTVDSDQGAQRSFAAPTRNTIHLGKMAAKAGDTVRSVAYRYFTSPSLLALVNHISFARGANPALPPGTPVQVPIAHGSVSGFAQGEQLLPGPGIQTGESLDRKWGRPQTVQLLRQAFSEVQRHWPQRHPAIVGSLSRQGGGKLGRHKSHRSGQDVDVGYYTVAANRKDWGTPKLEEIDYERTWYLVDWLEQSGHVAAIFMAPSIQRKLYTYAAQKGVPEARLRSLFQYGPKTGSGGALIRNSPGHRDHMHLRLWIPEDMQDIRAELGV
jgi:hypothetical protein